MPTPISTPPNRDPETLRWYLEVAFRTLDQTRELVDHNSARGGQIAAVSGALLTLLASNVIDFMDRATGYEHGIVQCSLIGGLVSFACALGIGGAAGFSSTRPQLNGRIVSFLASERLLREQSPQPVQERVLEEIAEAILEAERRQAHVRRLLRLASASVAAGILLALVAAITISVEVN